MAQRMQKEKGAIAAKFRAAWAAGQLDEAAKLLRLLADDLTDGYMRLSDERAAKLALKPTKTLKQFLALCDEETLKIFLHSSMGLAPAHPVLAHNMSRLLASSAQFPKLAEALVKCGAPEFFAEFIGTLPAVVDRASQPPFDASLMVASSIILTAVLVNKSQEGLAVQLLQSGALESLLNCIPFRDGRPQFSSPGSSIGIIGGHTLYFVSSAVVLCIDFTYAKKVHEGESADIAGKIVAWGAALLDLVSVIAGELGGEEEPGSLPQNCIDHIVGLLYLVGKGFPGVFDFQPSICLLRPLLQRFSSGDRSQTQSLFEGLERTSKPNGPPGHSNATEPRPLMWTPSGSDADLDFNRMQDAFTLRLLAVQVKAIFELSNFLYQRNADANYRQADLHEHRSLFPLAPLILGLLERKSPSDFEGAGEVLATALYVLFEITKAEATRLSELPETPSSRAQTEQLEEFGVRLLTWLKLRHSTLGGRSLVFIALGSVGFCSTRATWASLAALLNKNGFLRFCKEWFEADPRSQTFEETEDFAELILAPLHVPRGSGTLVHQTAIREALTQGRMLAWVFERAARPVVIRVEKRPNLLPLLALCSEANVEVSAFLTPELLRLFVQQLVRNWGACRRVTLPTLERENLMLRSMGDEFNRLAGHVRIVEAALCVGRRDAGGSWDPGYLAELRAAISDEAPRPVAANFLAVCEAEGVAVFASIVEERTRLERFRVRAEQEGYLLPEVADVAERVGAVWELVAAVYSLHPCANQACPRVEGQKGTFMRCGRCKIARYCSQACQKNHWKNGHKQACRV